MKPKGLSKKRFRRAGTRRRCCTLGSCEQRGDWAFCRRCRRGWGLKDRRNRPASAEVQVMIAKLERDIAAIRARILA